MPYCLHCGVKLNHRYTKCPLCQIRVEFPHGRKYSYPIYPKEINKISIIRSNTNPKDLITLNLLRFITILTSVLTIALNFHLDGKLSWSLISSLSLLFIDVTMSAILHLKRNPIILYTYINTLLCFYLYFLDLLTSGGRWFLHYALPCFISLQLLSFIIMVLFKFIKLKLLRAVSIILLTNAFLLIINVITTDKISWSLLTTAILLPTSIFLIFISKKVKFKESCPLTT